MLGTIEEHIYMLKNKSSVLQITFVTCASKEPDTSPLLTCCMLEDRQSERMKANPLLGKLANITKDQT